ncbi:MAG TPA: RNA 3'-terminal phosphate cyclase [Anaerolineae bacterium]|nr:RNA 3'-terminal phosphate cyclase [Anaerolineae bacterium]HQK14192.1 RNA 3'-terminal phosphate cyclase [Anaerolineae bacterium]
MPIHYIDGSHGEGGGQILRSALTLAALTGDAVRLENIRAHRAKPGLRPQHLTAVRAAAVICNAAVEGAERDSQTLTFTPQTPPQAGAYVFDVSDAAEGGSAGATTLVLQTVLLPLALADGPSRLILRGGTVVPMSPPTPYLEQVYLPMLFEMGVRVQLTHRVWGFYPQGGGELEVEIAGRATLRPLDLTERGAPERVTGIAFAARLPSHIPQRMSDRARAVLTQAGLPRVGVEPQHVTSPGVGAGLFLLAQYAHSRAGFIALGRQGLPSERVAEMACRELLEHHRSGAPVDPHLGDQLVLPFVLAEGVSRAAVSRVTQHLLTNVWVAGHFDLPAARVTGEEGQPGMLIVGE